MSQLWKCLDCGLDVFHKPTKHVCGTRGFKFVKDCQFAKVGTPTENPITALAQAGENKLIKEMGLAPKASAPDLVMEVQTAGDDRVKEAAQQLDAAWKDVEGAKQTTMRKALGFGALMISTKAWGKETKLIPHGTFDKWVAKNCPQVPRRTSKHYAQIAEAFLKKQKGSVALLRIETPADLAKALLLGEPSPELDALCDGETQRGLLGWQDEEEAEEKPKAGGFCPPEKKVQAWLKEHHPELVGTKFKKLPKAIAKAFQKQFVAGPRKDAAKQLQELIERGESDAIALLAEIERMYFGDDEAWAYSSDEIRKKLLDRMVEANSKLRPSLKAGPRTELPEVEEGDEKA